MNRHKTGKVRASWLRNSISKGVKEVQHSWKMTCIREVTEEEAGRA